METKFFLKLDFGQFYRFCISFHMAGLVRSTWGLFIRSFFLQPHIQADLLRALTLAEPQPPLAPRQLRNPHTVFPAQTQSSSSLARESVRQGFKGIELRFGELKPLWLSSLCFRFHPSQQLLLFSLFFSCLTIALGSSVVLAYSSQ